MWLKVPEHWPQRTNAVQGHQPVLELHRAPSQPEPLPLGPRVLPLGGARVMVHVIHPSVVLSLLCQGEERKEDSQIGTS